LTGRKAADVRNTRVAYFMELDLEEIARVAGPGSCRPLHLHRPGPSRMLRAPYVCMQATRVDLICTLYSRRCIGGVMTKIITALDKMTEKPA